MNGQRLGIYAHFAEHTSIVKEKYVKYLITIPTEVDQEENKNRCWNCVQTDINRCKIKNCREVKTELIGK
jgi:hypothetical protein